MSPQRLTEYLIVLIGATLLMVAGCTDNSGVAGATTETTNGLVGIILNNDNTVSPNTIVKILTEDYDPVSAGALDQKCIDTTDSVGNYKFEDINPGRYSVLARNSASLTSALIRNVVVQKDTVTAVQSQLLDKPGAISAKLMSPGQKGYVYIPGTDIFADITDDSLILIGDIPAGKFTDILLVTDNGLRQNLLSNEVEINPDDTIDIGKDTVPKAGIKKIYLNTSSTGASINSDLFGFPVLIRLNSSNFDFTQAKPDGRDLLFTGKDGRLLEHEIELWNSSSSRADIWVRIDTLLGNNSEQSIFMHWGNTELAQSAIKGRVFDIADGFKAVWHLDSSSDTICDATINRFYGIKHGDLKNDQCVIGYGLTFSGAEGYCDMGSVFDAGTDNFTVSAWIKPAKTGIQTIVAKSNGGDPYLGYGWIFAIDGANALHCFLADTGDYWGDPGTFHFWSDVDALIDFTKWYYVATVVDRSDSTRCKMYIDGEEVTDNSIGNITDIGPMVNNFPIRIGTESDGGFQFSGSIDDVIISHTVRSEDWIRLCYINQGPQNKLVVFESNQ